jgi:hypothetical protein
MVYNTAKVQSPLMPTVTRIGQAIQMTKDLLQVLASFFDQI